MSTTTIETPEPLWVFEKAVLVHAPEFDVACTARLRMAHDHNTDQGSVSIRIQLELANFGKQLLMLNIRPELVDTCTVVPKSNDNLIPDHLFPLVPVSVTNSAAVSTLILCLNSTSVVLVPRSTNDTTLSAAKPTDAAFHAFQRICRSNIIHLHFSKQQLKNDDIRQLRTFSGALRAGLLSAQPFDHMRLDAGRGAIEKDWRVFEASEDPPAYAASVKSVLGKRTRDGSPPEEPSLPAPCSLFYEECQLNENSVRENVDEGLTEIRDVTNDCTKEVQELAQQCMDSLDEHSKRLDASPEHELSKLKRWFAELAGSFLDKEVPKSLPTRRVSM